MTSETEGAEKPLPAAGRLRGAPFATALRAGGMTNEAREHCQERLCHKFADCGVLTSTAADTGS
jgi:hypothetical protein